MDHPGQFSRGIFHRVERKTDCFMASDCVSSLSGRPPNAPQYPVPAAPDASRSPLKLMPTWTSRCAALNTDGRDVGRYRYGRHDHLQETGSGPALPRRPAEQQE